MPEFLLHAWNTINTIVSSPASKPYIKAAIFLVVGLLVARALKALLIPLIQRATDDPQKHLILNKLTAYTLNILILLSVVRQLGFDLSVLLGTAGLLTVAIGFASQTSASNVISGLFLVAERPFSVGDVITVAQRTTGVVLSIDLLSIKLRTFDNLFVRVPNETVLKSDVVNLTRFPIRRYDSTLTIDYNTPLPLLRSTLQKLAETDPLCLVDPPPETVVLGFLESGLSIRFSVWTTRENIAKVRNSIPEAMLNAFREANISIPFPQRTISIRSADASTQSLLQHVATPTEPHTNNMP